MYTHLMPDPYQIGSGFTDKELEAANWWIRHRIALRRLGYGSLIFVIVIFWGYVLWSLLDAYIISYPREQRIPSIINDNQRLRSTLTQNAPQSIQVSPIASFPSTDNRRDFLVQITNPNTEWWADFTYHFKAGDKQTPDRKGYVLPGNERYLAEVGWKDESAGATPDLEVSNIHWHRVNPKDVERDYQAFATNRLQFQISDPTYTNDLKVGEQTVGQTDFTIRNASGYGYWAVDLVVVLMRDGTPAAVNKIVQTNFKPGESRPVTLNWFDNVTGISSTLVQPNVNILDPSVFLPTNQF